MMAIAIRAVVANLFTIDLPSSDKGYPCHCLIY
jgi:hypothetical protein